MGDDKGVGNDGSEADRWRAAAVGMRAVIDQLRPVEGCGCETCALVPHVMSAVALLWAAALAV